MKIKTETRRERVTALVYTNEAVLHGQTISVDKCAWTWSLNGEPHWYLNRWLDTEIVTVASEEVDLAVDRMMQMDTGSVPLSTLASMAAEAAKKAAIAEHQDSQDAYYASVEVARPEYRVGCF